MPLPEKKKEERPKTVKQRIYNELKNWIVDGTLQPGEKISDQEISKYFSVSRTPVHEAIQLLADQKLVNIYPGRETLVAPINFDELNPMYQIRAQLSILAIEFAYPKINDSIIQELKSINEKFHAANQRKDRLKATEYDGQFHNVFLQLADNHFLTEFIEVLRIHIQRFQMASDPYVSLIAKGDSSYDEHSAVIKALEQKDLEGAKTAMMTNWLHTIDVASHRQ